MLSMTGKQDSCLLLSVLLFFSALGLEFQLWDMEGNYHLTKRSINKSCVICNEYSISQKGFPVESISGGVSKQEANNCIQINMLNCQSCRIGNSINFGHFGYFFDECWSLILIKRMVHFYEEIINHSNIKKFVK